MHGGPATQASTTPTLWQLAVTALAVAAYALASHWLMVNAAHQPWAVAALFGPLLAAVAAGGWRRRHAPTLAFCAALLATLVVVVWRGGVDDINRMYVLQHAGIHLALAWTFASTLKPGSTALISALAARLHSHLTPQMQAYTRRLTQCWIGFFLGMIVLSVLIYLLAPWPWWSFFCNLLTPLAALLFFGGEYLLRYRLHPEFERVSWRRALGAYRGHG